MFKFFNKPTPQNTKFTLSMEISQFLTLIYSIAEQIYHRNHQFISIYLSKFLTQNNKQLIKEYQNFKNKINKRAYQHCQLRKCIIRWIHHELSPLQLIVSIWICYLQYQVRNQNQLQSFLTLQIGKFTLMIMNFFKKIYPSLKDEEDLTLLKLSLMNLISTDRLFKDIMDTYLSCCEHKKGQKGELTPSQIRQTVQQFQQLIKFSKIKEPFIKSIKVIKIFHSQHHLADKLKMLNETIAQIREEISDYRLEHQLEQMSIGSDEIFPVVNYVCQKSGEDILGSIEYIDCFLGNNLEAKQSMLRIIGRETLYNMTVVDMASSFYCHASQFMLPAKYD